MKARAIDFLTKPFHDQELFDAVRLGLDSGRREREHELSRLVSAYEKLTARGQQCSRLSPPA